MSADELAMLRELRGGERAATPPVLPQATMGNAPGTLVPGGSGLTEPPATARALSEEPEPRRFGSEPGNSVRESTAARAALTVVHDFGLQEKLHAGAEPWRRAAERWGLQSDNHEAQRLEYTVTSSLVFAPEPGSTSHKTIFDVMHAADTARQGRKAGHQKGVAEACPYCAPRVCGADCGWAAQRVRAVEIPFRPAPSRCWPVMIWSFVGLILAAAIGATVYWGIDRTGEHPVNGCGDTEGETQARLLMVGIAKTRLIGMCPQLCMSLAKAAQVEPEVVALTKITDVQSRRSLGPWRNPARELTGARQAETAVAVELTCSFSAGSANASTATNASSAWRRPLRRSGGYRYLADSRLRRAALGALEESISTGALSSAIRDDWGVEVKVIFLGIPSEVVASSADDQQQQQQPSIVCPEHSSAPPGSISADLCTCDPGFYKVGKVCYLCDPSSYCPAGIDYRVPCQSNAVAAPGSSLPTHCHCRAGYYGVAGGACTPCEFNFYCPGQGGRGACPAHSESINGGARVSIEECRCLPGWYGDNGKECVICPPGHRCAGGRHIDICLPGSYAAGNAAECTNCAQGYHSEKAAAKCDLLACPAHAVATSNEDIEGTTGWDACKCQDTPDELFYMSSTTLPGGLEWVECRSCSNEQCAPGQLR